MFQKITSAEFELFRKLVYTESGINLNPSKQNLVQSRLQKRLTLNKLKSFSEYYDLVVNDQSRTELGHMINCISTNKTSFFRESSHFDLINKRILPELVNRKGRYTIRVWSAGCSSGEEAYTIAMILYDRTRGRGNVGAKILATDISTEALRLAIRGVYSEEQVKDVPFDIAQKFFDVSDRGDGRQFAVTERLKVMVTFRRFNLLDMHRMDNNKFDIIFCRNVMIYFDLETRNRMMKHFCNILVPGGYFFLSHSEALTGRAHDLNFVAPAVYRKS